MNRYKIKEAWVRINNIDECVQRLYRNQIKDTTLHCIDTVYECLGWYESILKEVKKIGAKRVVDIGSNLNQFGYLFENEGIEYIGIDKSYAGFPIETKMIKFVLADYNDVKEQYKDDVVISCLCVGYLVRVEDVKAKHLIVNSFTGDEQTAKVLW